MTHKALQYDLALSPCRMASLPLTLPSSVQPYMPSYYHLNKPGLSWPQGSYILAVPPARPTLPRLILCIPYPPLECPALRTVPDHVNKNALTLQPLTGPVSSMTWITVWNTVFTFPPLCFPLRWGLSYLLISPLTESLELGSCLITWVRDRIACYRRLLHPSRCLAKKEDEGDGAGERKYSRSTHRILRAARRTSQEPFHPHHSQGGRYIFSSGETEAQTVEDASPRWQLGKWQSWDLNLRRLSIATTLGILETHKHSVGKAWQAGGLPEAQRCQGCLPRRNRKGKSTWWWNLP